MKYLILIIFVAISLTDCKSKYNTPNEYKGNRITFGSYGGFAGKKTEYTLLSNGDFYKGTGTQGSLDRMTHDLDDRAIQFFSNFEVMQFDTLNIDKTGNMTHYIVMYDKDKEPHRIQWPDYVGSAPKSLEIFHRNLFAFAKEINLSKSDKSSPLK